MKRYFWVSLALLFASILFRITLFAARAVAPYGMIEVTSQADDLNAGDGLCTMREALNNANTDTDTTLGDCAAGDGEDIVNVPAGLYTLTIAGTDEDENASGDLDVLDDVAITGAGWLTTTISGNQLDRVLHIALTGTVVTLVDLAITDGLVTTTITNTLNQDGGGILNQSGSLTITRGLISQNLVTAFSGDGGGIANRDGTLTLIDSFVSSNEAKEHGGGIDSLAQTADATVILSNSQVVSNSSSTGGGIWNLADAYRTAVVSATETLISGNQALGYFGSGGGIYNAIYIVPGARAFVVLDSSVVSNNYVESISGNTYGDGGGIRSHNGSIGASQAAITLTNSIIADNVTFQGDGGGIAVSNSGQQVATRLLIQNSTVSGNSTEQGNGGGIHAHDTHVAIIDSTLRDNRAYGDNLLNMGLGGGMWLGAPFIIASSTISGNLASGSQFAAGNGGGLMIAEGEGGLIVNSTVTGNSAYGQGGQDHSGHGGGIDIATGSALALDLINTTIVSNTANVAGGGIATEDFGAVTIHLTNTLVANNGAPPGSGMNCLNEAGYSDFISGGHNLEDADTCNFDQPTDWPNTEPLLGPLQDNGGPTLTHALLEGSHGIDEADNAVCIAPPVNAVDQRAVPRPQGIQCDIGAFEREQEADLNVMMSTSAAEIEVGDLLTYTITVSNDGPKIAADTILTDELPLTAALVTYWTSQGACDIPAGVLWCSLDHIESGEVAIVSIVVLPQLEGLLSNTAYVTSHNIDPDPSNNVASAITEVIPAAFEAKLFLPVAIRP
jgi:uncharacterized repeat protein (TIGR01451 family)